jgi:solute carrier family 25, member 38
VLRQAYGFTVYTQLLKYLESQVAISFPGFNKYAKYSVSAVSAKLVAMVLEAPLTLLKTRVERLSNRTTSQEIKLIIQDPLRDSLRGLGSSIVRESIYTFFHYNTFRFLKDSIFGEQLGLNSTFVPAFFAGVVAITASQPFEVIRSQVSLNKLNESIFSYTLRYFRQNGYKGFFLGFVPRLVRKPINSGICWTVYEAFRTLE